MPPQENGNGNDNLPEGTRITAWPEQPLDVDVGPVSLTQSAIGRTKVQGLWALIEAGVKTVSFDAYNEFINTVLCKDDDPKISLDKTKLELAIGVDSYRVLRLATEAFLLLRGATIWTDSKQTITSQTIEESRTQGVSKEELAGQLTEYLGGVNGALPYIRRIIDGFESIGVSPFSMCPDQPSVTNIVKARQDDLRFKVQQPFLLELIWNYWMEEGGVVQSINAVALRFQNKLGPHERDALANFELHPLRSLSNLLWGYVQDDDHRLTVPRRAYEYEHQYGLSLIGKAVPQMRAADRRSKFLEAFHALLHQAAIFYERASNLTIRADGFPLLNALREVHMLLAEGAHNQFRDLTWTARVEMLMQQWLLSRREMREFLGARPAVPYAEPWMSVVDALKRLLGMSDTPVTHFYDLATNGEQILLSIRYGDWSVATNEDEARGWAQFWKTEVQRYIHAYRAVTGVDLGATPVTTTSREVDATPPSVLLQQRIARQRGR